ncbi:hypothetical protein GCM10028799_76880 [Kribbella italica]
MLWWYGSAAVGYVRAAGDQGGEQAGDRLIAGGRRFDVFTEVSLIPQCKDPLE